MKKMHTFATINVQYLKNNNNDEKTTDDMFTDLRTDGMQCEGAELYIGGTA